MARRLMLALIVALVISGLFHVLAQPQNGTQP